MKTLKEPLQRAGASCKGSVTELRKRAKKYGGEKAIT